MEYGICNLGIVSVRIDGNDRSEIVTQLLFGEHFKILEETENWIRIQTAKDHYNGWICKKQYKEITYEDYDNLNINEFPVCGEIMAYLKDLNNHSMIPISYGAVLPYFHNKNCRIRKSNFEFLGNTASENFNDHEKYARTLLNTPYLWGGKGPLGIDCSGFTQLIYQLCGKQLPRDAYQQAELGDEIDTLTNTQTGDLAFFQNKEGKINHVGLILDNNKIIHASGKVRIDQLKEEGIYANDFKKITHKMHSIKRIDS